MEEEARLVRGDSEGGARGFGTMTYGDRLSGSEGAGEPATAMCGAGGGPGGGAPEPGHDNESGELLDPSDTAALDHFHEDALRQAGCGMSQIRVGVASGLAVCAASLELASVPFILPSAEIELCILPHEKSWLVLISLVGCALGALGWGGVCSRAGRRRGLLSQLAVNAVFAAVAAFMPTYPTFMMARFCSALGSGGIVPTCYTYVAEVTPRSCRHRALAWLVCAAGIGALISTALASAVLPQTGALTLVENKEHFSAWHRYLLLCILPILAALVSLIWTQESPRYLLEVGREVDAMTVYQSIHASNQVRLCGKGHVSAGGGAGAGCGSRGAAYRLAELALPGKRARPMPAHALHVFCLSLLQLFSATYRRTTLCLGGVLLFTTCIQFYLSSYVPETVVYSDSLIFEASKRTIQNASLYDEHYNTTLENVHYSNVTFTNCTFRDMLLSHVQFKNCSFYDVAFSNIKTSYTNFGGCLFVNSTIIDTDLELGRELDEWCVLEATVIRGMQGDCYRRADLTSRLAPPANEQSFVSHAMLIASVLALLPSKLRPLVALNGLLILLSPTLYFASGETALYLTEAVYRVLLTLVFFGVGCRVVDDMPANLRCTAHGLMLTAAYAGAAITRGVNSGGALPSAGLCAALAVVATALAVKGR